MYTIQGGKTGEEDERWEKAEKSHGEETTSSALVHRQIKMVHRRRRKRKAQSEPLNRSPLLDH